MKLITAIALVILAGPTAATAQVPSSLCYDADGNKTEDTLKTCVYREFNGSSAFMHRLDGGIYIGGGGGGLGTVIPSSDFPRGGGLCQDKDGNFSDKACTVGALPVSGTFTPSHCLPGWTLVDVATAKGTLQKCAAVGDLKDPQ